MNHHQHQCVNLIILSAVLRGCETSSSTLMEEGVHEQGAEENIWTYQREDVTGGCKKIAQ
jgi:hypothetical protein